MNEIKLLHLQKLETSFTTFLLHKYGKKKFSEIPVLVIKMFILLISSKFDH